MTVRGICLLLATLLLAGCVTTGPGTVSRGECRIFERPPYVVRGARQYDQDWIDSTIEGGIGGCHWARPAPRPARLDDSPAMRPAIAPAPKKRGLFKRLRDRVLSHKAAPEVQVPLGPVTRAPAEPPAIEQPPLVPPAPPPRAPIDELLDPRGGERR